MKLKGLNLILLFILFCATICFGQEQKFNRGYIFKKSKSVVQDKNFYLLTLLEKNQELSKTLAHDLRLKLIWEKRLKAIQNSLLQCKDSIACFTQNIYWANNEIEQVGDILADYYKNNIGFRNLVKKEIRPSGYFVLYNNLTDTGLLIKSWKDAAVGMNYILKSYTENVGLRYPQIDSVSFAVNGKYYRNLIREMMAQINVSMSEISLFFEPNLRISLELLAINNRNEAARYEPLQTGLNKKAFDRIATTKWDKYPYAIILIPGEGPENAMAISPNTKYRCQMGANRYKRGLAPFLIVSGGHVHPFQTSFCEAIEMKKYLIEECAIPEGAIIVEPHARHTTTNFRNATRIMAREGIPINKKSLCTTSIFQSDYIASDNFKKVNLTYLKYLPFVTLKRLNDFDIEFFPSLFSLQMDSLDPLDP